MEIHIDRPKLNKSTPQENLAVVDRWIADTADKLNAFIERSNRDMILKDALIEKLSEEIENVSNN